MFKNGAEVVIVDNRAGHGFSVGDIVTVVSYDDDKKQYLCQATTFSSTDKWHGKWYVSEEDISELTHPYTNDERYIKKIQDLELEINSIQHFKDNMYANIRFLEEEVSALQYVLGLIFGRSEDCGGAQLREGTDSTAREVLAQEE